MREYSSNPSQSAAFARGAGPDFSECPNRQVSISFGEKVSLPEIHDAWRAVTARHGILRSSFVRRGDGSLLVREGDAIETPWTTLDWQDEPAESIPEKWTSLLSEDAATSIDMSKAPCVRFHEILLPGGGAHFLLTVPAFLLDERSTAQVLVDWLLTLDRTNLAPAVQAGAAVLEAGNWREILAGADRLLTLHSRQDPGGPGEASVMLARDETSAFKEACKSHDLDPAAVLHGLWALTLRRHGATGGISFAVEDLSEPGWEAGFFENHLPVAHSFSGTLAETLRSLAEARSRVRASGLADVEAVLAAGEIPIAAHEERVVFEWRGPELNDLIRGGMPRWINFDAKVHRPPSRGTVIEVRDGFRLALRVSGPRWGAGAARDVLARFVSLIAGLPAVLDKPVRNVPVLEATEARSLRDLAKGAAGPEPAASLVAAFREVAGRQGGAVAVIDGDYRLTYAELDGLSDRLAGHLAHAALSGGWNVGLFLSHSSWIPIAIFGALKAGNAVVPVDPSAPPEWIESVLAANDAGCVFCDASSSPLLDATNRRRIVLDQEWETLGGGEVAAVELNHDTPAVILPGHCDGRPPELRALTHGMLLSAFAAGRRMLDFGTGDTMLAHSAAGGGSFLDEWLLPLLAGGTVRVADDEIVDPSTAEVTHVRVTAPEWANQASRSQRGGPLVSSSLRVVGVEAGNPNAKVAEIWEAGLPGGSRVFYSPAGLCGLGIGGGIVPGWLEIPIGLSVDDVEAAVCDEDGHDIAPGFGGGLFLKFQGWKKVAENATRRGLATGLRAWRDAAGRIFLESAGMKAPGIPTHDQRKRALAALDPALDAFVGEHVWTLGGAPGPFNVDEWPLGRSGWIDEAALPRPAAVEEKPAVVAKKPVVVTRAVEHWKPLVVLQEKGPGVRLVLVHPAAGDPAAFADLASAIGPTRRVVAFQARGLRNPDDCHPSIESAAAAYLDAVSEDDPGPFVLAGFGFGTAVVLEMARQMAAAGRSLPRLVLIGGIAPASERSGGWISSMRNALKLLSEGEEIEPGPLSGETAAVHTALWKKYRILPMDLAAELIIPSDFSKETIAAWISLVPGVTVEPVKYAWRDMLSFPAVKRIAALIEDGRQVF